MTATRWPSQPTRWLLPAVGILLVTGACGVRPAAREQVRPPESPALIFGIVDASPGCPVERPGHACAPRPVGHARVQARDMRTGAIVSTRTSASGHYSLTLNEGRYVLAVTEEQPLPRCPDVIVAVTSRAPVRADIRCDSGIR